MSRDQRVLDRHFELWRRRGLVTADLEARLREASAGLDRGRTGAAVRAALALLGGGLLLAGLVLILAENWEAIPRLARLGGWAVLHAGFLAAAHALGRRWPERPALAEAFAFVAGGWLLAGIALVSQLYHLNARPANGLWFWVALLLPTAWVLRRRAVSAVVAVAVTAALFAEVAESDSWVRSSGGDGPWLALVLPLLGVLAASLLPAPAPALRGVAGTWFFLGATFCQLVLGAAREIDDSRLGPAWALVGPGLALALAFPGRVFPVAWDAPTARVAVALAFAPWVLLGGRYDAGTPTDSLAVATAWLTQLALAVLVIRAGARAGAPGWVNLGYLALLAGILTRYFDFFGDFLEGGLALVVTGALLLAVLLVVEKARRRTLAREVRA